jgi:hypothetical protein
MSGNARAHTWSYIPYVCMRRNKIEHEELESFVLKQWLKDQ